MLVYLPDTVSYRDVDFHSFFCSLIQFNYQILPSPYSFRTFHVSHITLLVVSLSIFFSFSLMVLLAIVLSRWCFQLLIPITHTQILHLNSLKFIFVQFVNIQLHIRIVVHIIFTTTTTK